VDESSGLMIVADGMGGHSSGEVASGLVVKTVPENYRTLAEKKTAGETANPRLSMESNRLAFCVKMANQIIFEASKKYPKDRGMGTTCTAALISGDRLGVAHVGDSRAYLIRRGELQQLTSDHSLVMEQVRQGLISKEEASRSQLQNILTRALGTQANVEVDVDEHPLFPGDLVVLCSDGLFKDMSDEVILQTARETPDPKELVKVLIEKANTAGGRDNITVAAARVDGKSLAGPFKRLLNIFSR
jgi:protein phosphatase